MPDRESQRQAERARVARRTERRRERKRRNRHQVIGAEAVEETESEHRAGQHAT